MNRSRKTRTHQILLGNMQLALHIIILITLILSIFMVTTPAQAADQPVTLTITELIQIGDDLDTTTLGDFYANVNINGTSFSTSEISHLPPGGFIVPTGNLLSSPWVFTANVPSGTPSVQIHIEIVDSDWPDPNDTADIKAGPGETITIDVDLATGKWTGDVNWPQSCTSGPFDLDSDSAGICFDVNTISVSGDVDEDGLLDNWEQKGVDLDLDGVIDIDLPAFGANPFRKDIFVELDCIVAADHTHCPRQDSIEDNAYAFARASVSNLDGTIGVQLHVDVGPLYGSGAIAIAPGPGGAASTYGDFGGGGNQIPEAGNEIIESFSQPKGNGTPFADLKSNFFNDGRALIFHYAIFGHQTNSRSATNDCTSGEASDIPGHDFFVTLGGSPVGIPTFPCWGANANGLSVGTRAEQAGTFMHELGHTIGLHHGGNESIFNFKPNYLSVMNYSFQMCNVRSSPNGAIPGGCDYSRVALPPLAVTQLDETSLDECIGIDAGVFGFGPINWDADGILEGVTNCQPPNNINVQMDINTDGLKTLLGGFDDWTNLQYREGISGPGAGEGVLDEADPQTIEDAKESISDILAPGIVVTKTGPATALPGDVLNYSVEIRNEGSGPAFDAVLTDTAPDGTSQVSNIGAIVVGDMVTQDSNFTVPAEACPGEFTGASATLDFKDFVGNPLTASGSAPLEILDIVAPTITLSVSPTILWPPNHKLYNVAATISVTDECDPNPAVTLISIVSNEPATGFLGNGDKGADVMGAVFGTDDRTFSLRAERGTGGQNTGRVYTITYRVTDSSGNSSEATATVTVPTNSSNIP